MVEGVFPAERELRERLDVEQTMSVISRDFIDRGVADTDRCIVTALARIGLLTGTDRTYVFVSPDGGRTFDSTHEWCRPGTESKQAERQGVPADGFPTWWAQLQRGERVVVAGHADLGDDVAKLLDEAEDIVNSAGLELLAEQERTRAQRKGLFRKKKRKR